MGTAFGRSPHRLFVLWCHLHTRKTAQDYCEKQQNGSTGDASFSAGAPRGGLQLELSTEFVVAQARVIRQLPRSQTMFYL
ncbi:hypothetical protein EDB84DRAFT_1535421, partial [Lactarius hengduanensis]